MKQKPDHTKRERKALQVQVKQFVDLAQRIAAWDKLTEKERASLSFYQGQLGNSVETLAAAFDGPNTYFNIRRLRSLSVAINAAFVIGSRAAHNPIMRRLERKAQTAKATEEKLRSSRPINNVIWNTAAPVVRQHPEWTPHRVATEIRYALEKDGYPFKHEALRKRVANMINGAGRRASDL